MRPRPRSRLRSIVSTGAPWPAPGLPGRLLAGGLLLGLSLAALPLAEASAVRLEPPPDEGTCPTVTATPEEQAQGSDATPVAVSEGMALDQESLLVLRRLMPPEIWRSREVFFFEGMRMVVGACHRRYASPSFYREATERHRGEPRLDRNGNLRDYSAGVPFPPEDIADDDPRAGLKWAWNLENRYRGAGHRGRFRVTDLPTALGGILTFEGRFFLLQTRHRADLATSDYRIERAEKSIYAAGGEFTAPFDARHLAWRQIRPAKTLRRHTESDDVFVYVPTMRKSRRAATNWVDGYFFPRYTSSGDAGGGGMAVGGGFGTGAGAISPTAGQSIAATEHTPRGFTGMLLRPNAYIWRVAEVRDVLAPINVTEKGWPDEEERNFGPSGLSLASDTWDVRRAVVLEGALKVKGRDVRSILIYVDWQTRTPLYWITRGSRKRFHEIGILAHRFSDDTLDYPEWPGGYTASVFEPVAASFYNALQGGGGWRRESYEIQSLPVDQDAMRRMTSTDALGRGH